MCAFMYAEAKESRESKESETHGRSSASASSSPWCHCLHTASTKLWLSLSKKCSFASCAADLVTRSTETAGVPAAALLLKRGLKPAYVQYGQRRPLPTQGLPGQGKHTRNYVRCWPVRCGEACHQDMISHVAYSCWERRVAEVITVKLISQPYMHACCRCGTLPNDTCFENLSVMMGRRPKHVYQV